VGAPAPQAEVAVFATAAVANSMAELWVMQTYLQPDQLEAVGLRPFGAWPPRCSPRTHRPRLAPDGSSYRMQTRFARFQNVPELLTLYRQVADVRTLDDLDLPPRHRRRTGRDGRGRPDDSLVVRSRPRAARADAHPQPGRRPERRQHVEGHRRRRAAALDLRLVGLDAPTEQAKLDVTAQPHLRDPPPDHRYADDHGQLTLRPGALQLVFCDVSTPAGDGWAHDELKSLLVRRVSRPVRSALSPGPTRPRPTCSPPVVTAPSPCSSVPPRPWASAPRPDPRRMHHLDAPGDRPTSTARRPHPPQGNQNPEVRILRYVTEGSFDTYMWQTLERKAAFIAQVTAATCPMRRRRHRRPGPVLRGGEGPRYR
jgi:hypothetical protein